jgi:hypothetical protein
MFTVSQYDSYSYLFYQPTFISLDSTATPNNIVVKGHTHRHQRHHSAVGQAYIPLNTTVTSANYTSQGEVLSNVGTVIGLQSGPADGQFFLQFDTAGQPDRRDRRGHARDAAPALGPVVADVGVRTFAQVNSTLSQLTGVPHVEYGDGRPPI